MADANCLECGIALQGRERRFCKRCSGDLRYGPFNPPHAHGWPCLLCGGAPTRWRVEPPAASMDEDPNLPLWWYLEAQATTADDLRHHLRQAGLTEAGDAIITKVRQ